MSGKAGGVACKPAHHWQEIGIVPSVTLTHSLDSTLLTLSHKGQGLPTGGVEKLWGVERGGEREVERAVRASSGLCTARIHYTGILLAGPELNAEGLHGIRENTVISSWEPSLTTKDEISPTLYRAFYAAAPVPSNVDISVHFKQVPLVSILKQEKPYSNLLRSVQRCENLPLLTRIHSTPESQSKFYDVDLGKGLSDCR